MRTWILSAAVAAALAATTPAKAQVVVGGYSPAAHYGGYSYGGYTVVQPAVYAAYAPAYMHPAGYYGGHALAYRTHGGGLTYGGVTLTPELPEPLPLGPAGYAAYHSYPAAFGQYPRFGHQAYYTPGYGVGYGNGYYARQAYAWPR